MVATKRSSTHVEFNPKQKGGGGGGGAGAGGGSSSSSSVVSEGGVVAALIEPLGGFIFVCNNDTMNEDFERHLFGLPQRYQDTVRAIQPGLPLFLYNYSTRCLHGVFEASSDGGLNLEPGAWENKDTRKNGRQQSSRFPAQVRVRWREQRPPLEEETFRPLLYHYDGPKFRLELSKAEADDLLKLFGTTSHHHQEMVEAEEDFGGEWEKVKSKSKLTRINRPPPSKRSTSPNSPAAGRKRWGPLANGSATTSSTAGAAHSSHNTPVNGDAFIHGRESRADIAQRWRSDSDSWSGSSSAGISSSSWVSQDDDNSKPKKGSSREDGGSLAHTSTTGEFCESHDETILKGEEEEQANGCLEDGSERDSRADSEELCVELNAVRSNKGWDPQLDPQAPVRGEFISYSAALKAGTNVSGTESCNIDGLSPNAGSEGGDGGQIASTIVSAAGSNRASSSSTGVQGRQEQKEDVVIGEGEVKRGDKVPAAWSNSKSTLAARLAVLPSPKGLHSRKGAQTPPFQPSCPVHEPWRGQQNDQLKQEEQAEEKVHVQNMQSHQYRQLGQNLMPLRIPTPTPSSLQQQQHHRHPPVSPAPSNTYYRDRAQARMRTGASSVDAGPHLVAYRPISRVPPDGGTGFQNGYIQGGWGFPSPVPLLTPMSPIGDDGFFALPPPQLLGNVDILHMEIAEFAAIARPSPDARIRAEAAVDCVREAVKQLWPGADVEVFGSFATGLCLPHSDVDVVVVDSPPLPDTPETAALSGARALAPLIRVLGTALRGYGWCESLNTIDSASMPVIKLHCRPSITSVEGCQPTSPTTSVAIDITIGGRKTGSPGGRNQEAAERPGSSGGGESLQINAKFEAATKSHNGAAAREYVIERLRQFPALAPLVLLLKSYLHHRGLNDVYTGGLGSFSLTLMLVFYLERAPVSCGISQGSLRPQEAPPPPSESALASSSVSLLPLSKPPVDCSLASVSSGTDSLDSFDEGASYSSGSTDTTTLASTRTSASSSSSSSCCSETSLSHGGTPITINLSTPVLSSSGEPAIRRAGGIVEELLISMQSVPPPNLGLLLIGFLQSFGREIDFSHVRLVLKGRNGTGGGLFWADKVSRPMALCIDDPLRPGANIGAGSFNMFHVQVAMQDMLQMLTRSLGVTSSERVDNTDPSCRQPLRLLDQLFVMDNLSAATQ
ncbi:hypothetical protein CY35_10G065600 [Sphagnum magellanicum]|nr:hypothetical protein CY35_10G065600 [Sphagnum magellanicum]